MMGLVLHGTAGRARSEPPLRPACAVRLGGVAAIGRRESLERSPSVQGLAFCLMCVLPPSVGLRWPLGHRAQ